MIEDGSQGIVGDKNVIAALNLGLKGELTAINQYFLHARMLENWGFKKRGKEEYEESIEEMKHADRLIQRILLLGGLPNLQDLGKLYIGENLKELIECDLKLELEGIAVYRKAIGLCEAAKDYVSRDLIAEILEDEEEHQDHNKTELELIVEQAVTDATHDHDEVGHLEGLELHAASGVRDLLDPDLRAGVGDVRRQIEAELGAPLNAAVDLVHAGLLLLGTDRIDLRLVHRLRVVDRVVGVDIEAGHRIHARADLAADLAEGRALVGEAEGADRKRVDRGVEGRLSADEVRERVAIHVGEQDRVGHGVEVDVRPRAK